MGVSVKNILVLHGVNLNMFGKRDPAVYGTMTLAQIDEQLVALGKELNVAVTTFQSNLEGEMCSRIHQAFLDKIDAIVINAGAWTHYSYALGDAIELFKNGVVVEVHMSNVHARDPFRHFSVMANYVKGQICGFGPDSYLLGLRAAANILARAGT